MISVNNCFGSFYAQNAESAEDSNPRRFLYRETMFSVVWWRNCYIRKSDGVSIFLFSFPMRQAGQARR